VFTVINPVHAIAPHLFKIRFLSYTPIHAQVPKWYVQFFIQILYAFLISAMYATCPSLPPHPLYVIITTWCRSSSFIFSILLYFLPFRTKYPHHSVIRPPQICIIPLGWEIEFHNYTEQRVRLYLYLTFLDTRWGNKGSCSRNWDQLVTSICCCRPRSLKQGLHMDRS
jgi:hypothetical protein